VKEVDRAIDKEEVGATRMQTPKVKGVARIVGLPGTKTVRAYFPTVGRPLGRRRQPRSIFVV